MKRGVDIWQRLAEYPGALWMLGIQTIGLVALAGALPEGEWGLWWRQLAWLGGGLLLVVVLSLFDYRDVVDRAWPILLATAALLAVVLLVGKIGGGSQRWIGLGPLRVQPSELAKLAVIVWATHWAFGHPRPGGAHVPDLLVPAAVVGAMSLLVLVQPDLGTAVAIGISGLSVFLIAGIAWKLLVALGITGIGGAIGAWFFVLRPYQRNRVIGFLNPEADPLGIGYHTLQSKIAVGGGGVWGAGFGRGTQTSLHFLPEQHTDFIFSVWSEEWGFVGSIVLLALYAGLLTWLARTALEARDTVGRLLVGGIFVHFAFQIGVNIAMTVGLAPVVGIPLPWMTYGGSSALVNCAAFGLALSVRQRRRMFFGL